MTTPMIAPTSTARRVADVLGLDESYWPWLADLTVERAASGAPLPLAALRPGETACLLQRLGCETKAIADVVATLPDAERDNERWWLLERCHRRLVGAMGDLGSEPPRLPPLPASMGTAGACFPIHVFVATVPAVRAWHAARGVPDDVSWATLADLGRHVAIEQRRSGRTGLDAPWWLMLHVRGAIFEVGSLQYAPYCVGGPGTPSPWFDERDARRLGAGFRPGDLSFGIHIPAGAQLDRDSCSSSLSDARRLFDDMFPGRMLPAGERRIVTCSSWLLDDQLAAYLPARSKILEFQRLFTLVPCWAEADGAVLDFVFHNQGVAPDAAHARTSLQRGVLTHLGRGDHFRWRTGWCELPPAPTSPPDKPASNSPS